MLQVFQTLLQLPRFHGVPLKDTLLQWCSSGSIGQHRFYHQTLDIDGICSQYQHRNRFVCLTHFLWFSHTKSKFYFSKAGKPTSAHCPKFWVTSWCCFVFFRDTVPSPRSAACLSLISRADGRRRASPSHHSNTCTEEEQKRNNSSTILRSWVTKNELDISSFLIAFVWYIVLVGCGGRPMGCEKLDSLSCQRFYSRLLPVFVCSPFPLTPPFSPSYLPYTRHNWLMLSSWLFLQSHRSWCVFDKWKW